LNLQLPPDTLNDTVNIDDDWVADRRNVSGNEHGAGLTPVADLYKKGPEFRSLFCCKTMTWDVYMLPLSGEVRKLRRAMQTSDIEIRQHHYEETIGKRGFMV